MAKVELPAKVWIAPVHNSWQAKGRDCGSDRLAPPDQDPEQKKYVDVCGEKDGKQTVYRLDQQSAEKIVLERARAQELQETGDWAVNLSFAPSDAATITELTTQTSSAQQQIALVADGEVLYAAAVTEPVPDNVLSISSGGFSEQQARELARTFGGD